MSFRCLRRSFLNLWETAWETAALLVVVTLLGLNTQGSTAAPRANSLGNNPERSLQMEPVIHLEAVTAQELGAQHSTISLGDRQLFAGGTAGFSAGSGIAVQSSIGLAGLPTVVVRELPDLWQIRLTTDTHPSLLDVTYELVSRGGRSGHLSHRVREDKEIPVRLQPIQPTVVEQQGGSLVIRGGVILELDLAAASISGSYSGTITATVEEL